MAIYSPYAPATRPNDFQLPAAIEPYVRRVASLIECDQIYADDAPENLAQMRPPQRERHNRFLGLADELMRRNLTVGADPSDAEAVREVQEFTERALEVLAKSPYVTETKSTPAEIAMTGFTSHPLFSFSYSTRFDITNQLLEVAETNVGRAIARTSGFVIPRPYRQFLSGAASSGRLEPTTATTRDFEQLGLIFALEDLGISVGSLADPHADSNPTFVYSRAISNVGLMAKALRPSRAFAL